MHNMEHTDQIAFCGVNCAACDDYRSGTCPSCRRTAWGEDPCPPVKCCQARGIAFCAFCEGFPCVDMRAFYQESEGHREAWQRMADLRRREAL